MISTGMNSQLSVAEESTGTAMNRNQLSVAEESTGTAMNLTEEVQQ